MTPNEIDAIKASCGIAERLARWETATAFEAVNYLDNTGEHEMSVAVDEVESMTYTLAEGFRALDATVRRVKALIPDHDTEGWYVPLSALARALDGDVTP